MHGWSGALFQEGKRDGKHWWASCLLVCEFDAVKYPDSDVIDWGTTTASNPRISDIETIPSLLRRAPLQSCDPSRGVFVGLIVTISPQLPTPTSSRQQQSCSTETWRQRQERSSSTAGTDKVCWWGGLSPEHPPVRQTRAGFVRHPSACSASTGGGRARTPTNTQQGG